MFAAIGSIVSNEAVHPPPPAPPPPEVVFVSPVFNVINSQLTRAPLAIVSHTEQTTPVEEFFTVWQILRESNTVGVKVKI
ncbi:hypothetical protein OAD98_02340 [Flavobacteriales bacterium]|nr:hypothetical protein [Flavobacteriales bacterium]